MTHNKMSRHCPPSAALPSLSRATSTMDPKHGVAPPCGYRGARGRGSSSSLSFPLFWAPKGTRQKLRDRRGRNPRWPLLRQYRHNNQPNAADMERGWLWWEWDALEAHRVGGINYCCLGQQMGQQKKRERDRVLSLKRPPLAQPTQQPPKTVPTTRWVFWRSGCGGILGEDNYRTIRAMKN